MPWISPRTYMAAGPVRRPLSDGRPLAGGRLTAGLDNPETIHWKNSRGRIGQIILIQIKNRQKKRAGGGVWGFWEVLSGGLKIRRHFPEAIGSALINADRKKERGRGSEWGLRAEGPFVAPWVGD